MDDPEAVEIGHSRHDLGELEAFDEQDKNEEARARIFTKRKRFSSGLELVYRIMFPLGIHSVTMQKQHRSTDTETPNKGKMFGWSRCFQLIISRHNFWTKAKQWECARLIEDTL